MTKSLEELLKIHGGYTGLAKYFLELETYNDLGNIFVKAVNSYFKNYFSKQHISNNSFHANWDTNTYNKHSTSDNI